jgi:hypothetical protein
VTFLAAWVGINRHHHEMQSIGRDSAPSIIAAQKIRASLAEMQLDFERQLLDNGAGGTAAGVAYEQRRQSAATALVSAAENITYGDAEREPIRTLVFSTGTFEQDVARARVLHDRKDPSWLSELRDADRVIHETLLPAADALDKANLDALNDAYNAERLSSGLGTAMFVIAAVTLLVGLILVQGFLCRRMRRVFNLPLIGAGLGLAWLLVSLVGSFLTESRELKVVKEDSFDSIHALSLARAYAYDARACQLLALLDPQRADEVGRRFSDNSAKLVTLNAGETLESIVTSADGANRFTGCLADELHNITFDGELEAAQQTLRGYAQFLASSELSSRLAGAGDPRGIRVAISDSPDIDAGPATPAARSPVGGCGYAFNQFDDALGQTLAINQREFDAALDRGMSALDGRIWISLATLGAVAILTYVGPRPRLQEYAA